jgi:hypothetical protein
MAIENEPVYTKDLQLASKAAPNDAFMQRFIALHMYGAQRAEHDTAACQDAVTSDQAAINTWSKTHDPHALVRSTTDDLAGDRQAMGSGGTTGDDAKNIAADRQIMAVDQRYLQQHPTGDLSDQIRKEIGLLQRDARYSFQDQTRDEPEYIKDDTAFLNALQQPDIIQIDKARQQMFGDRGMDIRNETSQYIPNDQHIQQTSTDIVNRLVSPDVLRQFGTLHITD